MRVNENILISSLTTMRLGGPARYVLEVETPGEVSDAYGFAEQYNYPVFVLGYGANTIGHDEGFPGVIIINRMRGITEQDISNGWPSLGGPQPSCSEDGGKCEDRTRSKGSSQQDPSSETMTAEPIINNIEDRTRSKESSRQDPSSETMATGPAESIKLKIMGGEYWDNVVAYACERGLTGIEALSKIPGLAGAAPIQNIGAYGQQISDCLESIDVYDRITRTFKTLPSSSLNFSYRKSALNTTEKNRYFVISITLLLKQGEMSRPFYNSIENYLSEHNITDTSPQSIRKTVSAIRADKLPDPIKQASAGSFFKNIYLSEEQAEIAENKGYPVHRGKDGNKINSGWLIEQCGLSGKLLHGIRVSDKASLVLINESAQSYNDLSLARGEIISKVYDKFGFWLEQEPVELQ